MAAPYELIYYTGVPGRGEHIRLILEEAGASYTDTGSLGLTGARDAVTSLLPGSPPNPPYFAPPLFRHGDLLISQTSNILMYLGSQLGLAGSKDGDAYRVNALAITALDGLSEEVHDTHHPLGTSLYYEEQKEESRRCSAEWVKGRLPAWLAYWERVLESGGGQWVLGEEFTYADLVLFQCVDGTMFAFPKAMGKAREEGTYGRVFGLWEAVKKRPNVKKYLESERRQKYDWGIYRHYPDNDVVAE
jgi:glutathione S-transferase